MRTLTIRRTLPKVKVFRLLKILSLPPTPKGKDYFHKPGQEGKGECFKWIIRRDTTNTGNNFLHLDFESLLYIMTDLFLDA